ncbi:MAG TPA: glycosyltransferase family 1 protein [Novosphingobium sp.]|jgi:glycosyltransferase involved in cell wall biosynthesis|nr:glycosyltransferase family 1 protein [Novosphingobium sp.]
MADSPIRVAFDDKIFSSQTHGGISRYFVGMVPHLAGFGVEARVFAPIHVNSYLPALPHDQVFGTRVREFRGRPRLSRLVNGPLSRLAMRRFKPQIVHETYYAERSEAPKGCRIVLTVYDMIHELFADQMADPATIRSKAAAIARADLILCISESTRRDLIRFYPQAEARSRVTYLGFDADFAAQDGPARSLDRPYLLYVGQRRGYKNFAALLDAYAASPSLRDAFDLVCVGGGPFDATERQAIAGHGLGQAVRQCGADDDELRRWYRGAAIFVYPSLYEGFGIPPLEAMASGVPVVAVDVSSVPEVCAGAAELAPDGSAEALRAAIEAVAFDSDRASALCRAGLERIDRFSWAGAARDTAACYRELI